MASSRLEKVGTIFSRTTGLLKSGALKQDDKPIWYDVYKTFPPKHEPRYDRPAANISIKNIFYAEDTVRAQFHKANKSAGTVNFADHSAPTVTQKFLSIYSKLRAGGKEPEEKLFDVAYGVFRAEGLAQRESKASSVAQPASETSLAAAFKASQQINTEASSLNIKDLFEK